MNVSLTLCALVALAGSAVRASDLPEFRTIPAARPEELTPADGWPSPDSRLQWSRSLGGPTSDQYSGLTQIDRSNVGRLTMAWTYHSRDGAANIQCNPIAVDGIVYLPTAGRHIAAVDGASGRELWRFDADDGGHRLEDQPARRGLLYWPGDAQTGARIIFAAGDWVYELDAQTGKAIKTFGEDGRAPLPTGGTAIGAVWKQVLVMPGFTGDVFGYDLFSGRLLWRFHTMPRPGEYGYDTWQGQETGANCWGGMALDDSRGIAYVTTGSPKPNYLGFHHLGNDLFGNCVIALDAATGRRLWYFQEIRHDIWDLDPAAPPNLVTVSIHGHRVDAVAQVTKLGNTLLLDRVSGKPLFPFRLRRAPPALAPGEETAPYQPAPELPQPFVRHQFAFSPADVTDRTPEARAYVERELPRANYGWFVSFQPAHPTIYYGMHGGAEWTGAAFDPATGRLYVTANELPWSVTILEDDDPPPAVPTTQGERLYRQDCAGCHGPDRRGIGMVPPLLGLRHRMTEAQVLALWKTGRNQMPPAPPMTDPEHQALLKFLFGLDRPRAAAPASGPRRYVFGGYHRLLDDQGYPGIKPPWGTLTCLDLNTGKIDWQVPLGEYPELKAAGIPKTGTENFGGPLATAGGLVFCSGTRDNRIRAFDLRDGTELWSASLPLHGTAPPSTYLARGRQFVLVPATGGGKLGGPTGDAWVAFALPQSDSE